MATVDARILHTPVMPASSGVTRFLELTRLFAARSLKTRYRGSILGVYWSLCNPLIMTAIYTAVFGSAFASYYGGSLLNYVLACFVGLVVLNFFSQTSTQALSCVVSNGPLLNKIRIPLATLPLSVVAANLFQYLVGVLPLMLVVTAIVSRKPTHVIAMIIPSISLLMMTIGFSYAVAALYVFFRDLPYLYELVVFVLWITSPIFYPSQLVPEAIRGYVGLNPLAAIIGSVRDIAFTSGHVSRDGLLHAFADGGISLIVGVGLFAALRSDFMDLL
jgi:ABC-type polysaccharide/polyol phosphate export permease